MMADELMAEQSILKQFLLEHRAHMEKDMSNFPRELREELG